MERQVEIDDDIKGLWKKMKEIDPTLKGSVNQLCEHIRIGESVPGVLILAKSWKAARKVGLMQATRETSRSFGSLFHLKRG